jgi:hypothetical protein
MLNATNQYYYKIREGSDYKIRKKMAKIDASDAPNRRPCLEQRVGNHQQHP